MKNIVVLVSGGGTNLQALIDAEKRGELGDGKITLVVSSKPDAYALKRAKDNFIRTKVLARSEYADIAAYSKAMADTLKEAGADLVVYAGFMTILDEQVCRAFPNRMMNVHPALIPSFWIRREQAAVRSCWKRWPDPARTGSCMCRVTLRPWPGISGSWERWDMSS